MLDPQDAMTEQALQRGQRNAQAIVLIKKHCAHARVERSPVLGHSMLEDMTRLPISGREMRCRYGTAPTHIGLELIDNAVAFYEQNCVGCPHRQVQAIPNLKAFADQLIEDRRRKEEQAARARDHEQAERDARARRRVEEAAAEPPATRALIALLDGLDAEQPDGRGDELADLCRLQPELCTPRAADILLEAASRIFDDRLFAALRHLDTARRLDRDRLLAAAIGALAHRPLEEAARIVVTLSAGLAPGQLVPALRSIIRLGAPLHDFGMEPTPELEPLRIAIATELPGVLDVLCEGLGHEQKYPRRAAAAGAQRVIELEPATAEVLVVPLLDALELPGSLDHYLGDPRGELLVALGAAFRARPDTTAAAIEQRGAGAEKPICEALFRVYDGTIRRGHRSGGAPPDAGAIALDAAFRRVSGDWGEDVARAAADLVELAARWEPDLMAERVDALFGALLTSIATPANRATRLDLPPDVPPMVQALQAHHDQVMRSATIRNLRKALGHLVPVAPEAVARNVFSIIEAPEIDTEEGKDLRDEAIRLLGDLGRRADLLPDVLPALWTALLHADQRVRAHAIMAWGEIAGVPNRRLPADLGDLVPALLEDRYVVVHKRVVHALARGLPIPDHQRQRVVLALLALADLYKNDDSDVLDDILSILWDEAAELPANVEFPLRERCLQLAEQLDRYDKERYVVRRADAAAALPSYLPRLVEIAADPQRPGHHRDDEPLRRLRDLPAGRLQPHLDAITDAARSHLPDDTWEAQRFVEILQRAGGWKAAAMLATEIVAVLPDDVEHAIQRDGVVRLEALCQAQASLADGRPADARAALQRAYAADARLQAARDEQHFPWEAGE